MTFAIRCSMSIPAFFKPLTHNGRPVFDGGLLNNFPASDWTSKNPDYDFIGIYLGPKAIDPTGSGRLPSQLLSLITDRNDPHFIDKHRERVILVDPEPIGTYDFDLSAEERDFLVLQGRADALEHMYKFPPKAHGPSEAEVNERRSQAEDAKKRASAARKRRKRNKLVRRSLFVAMALIVIASAFYFGWHWYKLITDAEASSKLFSKGAIEGLSQMGWTVKPLSDGRIQFEISDQYCPNVS